MGFLRMLFGKNKLRRPNREQFFSIIAALVSLAGRTDLRLTGNAGIVFNPVESRFFKELDSELRKLLEISGRSSGTQHEIKDDSHGTRWVVFKDPEFEDLATTIHLVGETITEHGYGDRLIAAVFGLNYEQKTAYWVYNIKRGTFYPLVLSGKNDRDNAAEMRLGAIMEQKKIPVERSLEQWYALWGIPF